MDISLDIENLICPITQEIFKDPVVADDQIIYERDAIEDWLLKNNISPITRHRMTNILISTNFIKNLVNIALCKYPELKELQYKISDIERIKVFMNTGRYDNIKKYKDFDLLSLRKNDVINTLVDKKQIDVLKYILDNATSLEDTIEKRKIIHVLTRHGSDVLTKYLIDKNVDLECEEEYKWRPIHFVCRYLSEDVIKYIIDKGVNLECETNEGWRPIHFICRYSTTNMIKYIIDKGVNLNCETKNKLMPIHLLCEYSTPEMIKYIIDKGANLECETESKSRPIHLICQYSTPEMIKYIIDKNVDIESQNMKGWAPIHLICRNSTPEMVKYIIEKNVNLEIQTNDGWTPLHIICRYSNVETIKYIINKKVNMEVRIKKYNDQDYDFNYIDLLERNEQIDEDELDNLMIELTSIIKE